MKLSPGKVLEFRFHVSVRTLLMILTAKILSVFTVLPIILIIMSNKQNSHINHGHNSLTNLRKMRRNNPNLDLINVNMYTKFGRIVSIHSLSY